MPERIPQSIGIRVPLQAYLASDHVAEATGKTIAITISKNGAAYGNPSAGATNAVGIASGSYYVDLSTTDTGTAGPLFVKGTEGTIDTIIAIYNVVNANTGGMAALPNAAAEAAGGLYTRGTGTGQVAQDSAGTVNANATLIAGDIDAPDLLMAAARTMTMMVVGSGSTTTSIVTSSMAPAAVVANQFAGQTVRFDLNTTTANLRGQMATISASTSGGVLTVSALTTAPVNGDFGVIV